VHLPTQQHNVPVRKCEEIRKIAKWQLTILEEKPASLVNRRRSRRWSGEYNNNQRGHTITGDYDRIAFLIGFIRKECI
jgi:hypothetical protein